MGDESQLKRDYNIWSSDHVVIEIVDSDLPDGFISEVCLLCNYEIWGACWTSILHCLCKRK